MPQTEHLLVPTWEMPDHLYIQMLNDHISEGWEIKDKRWNCITFIRKHGEKE